MPTGSSAFQGMVTNGSKEMPLGIAEAGRESRGSLGVVVHHRCTETWCRQAWAVLRSSEVRGSVASGQPDSASGACHTCSASRTGMGQDATDVDAAHGRLLQAQFLPPNNLEAAATSIATQATADIVAAVTATHNGHAGAGQVEAQEGHQNSVSGSSS